jgi:hypothetical protein
MDVPENRRDVVDVLEGVLRDDEVETPVHVGDVGEDELGRSVEVSRRPLETQLVEVDPQDLSASTREFGREGPVPASEVEDPLPHDLGHGPEALPEFAIGSQLIPEICAVFGLGVLCEGTGHAAVPFAR